WRNHAARDGWGRGLSMDGPAADAGGGQAAVSAGDAAARDGQPLIITVHGTFASELDDEGEAWWQRGSAFTKALAERLAEKGIPEFTVRPFHWTGLNSDQARLRAAAELAGVIAST